MDVASPPLVSVITPVYNGEKYLAECIESVLAQTYPHWEYIIVNNCSTDHSLTIAQEYAERDRRIRIHNNDGFVGAIQNHNIAFRQIREESIYCKVVHADDWLFPECIAQMVKVAQENPSVGIVGSYRLVGEWVSCDGLPYPSTVVPGRQICRSTLLGGPYVFGSPTSLLVRSDVIRSREAFYNETHIGADTEACFDVLQTSDFGFVHQVLTYTRRHSEAATSFAERFNTYILGELIFLKKYGPVYLNREEYEARLKLALDNYYEFLGRNFFRRRERAFWDYHRSGLASLGYPVDNLRLAKASFLRVIAVLSYPVRALRRHTGRIQEHRKKG
jgi:glycosyltransferase involved in cell wall biosynthesis